MPILHGGLILIGKFQLIRGVDLRIQLEGLDRRPVSRSACSDSCWPDPHACTCSVRVSVSGLYCSVMMRRTAPLVGSIKTMPPFNTWGELGNALIVSLSPGGVSGSWIRVLSRRPSPICSDGGM